MRAALAAVLALALAGCGASGPGGSGQGSDCAAVQPQPQTLPGATSRTYAQPGERALRVHVFGASPGARKPAVLFFFGGGWRSGTIRSFEPQARELAAHGYVALLADYRVACRDGTTLLAAQDDAEAAWKWLLAHADELGADPDRLVLAGGSAGGQLAAATAQRFGGEGRPAALVLFNPALDLVGPAPVWAKWLVDDYSPAALPIGDLPPTLIFHGEADRTVPLASIEAFRDRAEEAGRQVTLVTYPGEKHGFFHRRGEPGAAGRYEDTTRRMSAFLDERFGGKAPR